MSEDRNVHADLVEQVMRACTTDTYVIPFMTAAPGSKEFRRSLGRLLEHNPRALVPDTPLAAYAEALSYRNDWRSVCSPVAGSVWSELALHESVGEINAPAQCPMLRLLQYREIQVDLGRP